MGILAGSLDRIAGLAGLTGFWKGLGSLAWWGRFDGDEVGEVAWGFLDRIAGFTGWEFWGWYWSGGAFFTGFTKWQD